MAQTLTQKTVNTFVKGLITESSELTHPEGASVDELNCSLEKDGSRRRRSALRLETDSVLSPSTQFYEVYYHPDYFSNVMSTEGQLINTTTWKNVGGKANLEFLVVQVGDKLYFLEKAKSPLAKSWIMDDNVYGFLDGADKVRFREDFSSVGTETSIGYNSVINGIGYDSVSTGINWLTLGGTNYVHNKFPTVKINGTEYYGDTSEVISSSEDTNLKVAKRIAQILNDPTQPNSLFSGGYRANVDPSTSAIYFTHLTYVNLSGFTANNNHNVAENRVQVTSINGALVVASPAIDTFYIEYDTTTKQISSTQIDFKERDFEWQGTDAEVTDTYFDTLTAAEPETFSLTRQYDAKNCGWSIDTNASTTANPPKYTGEALTHPWYSGKDADGDYNRGEFLEVYTGTSLTSNGRLIVDVFNKVRALDSDTDLATEVETERFRTVAAYAGRVFFSGIDSAKAGGKVYFSGLLNRLADIGHCYQRNDPTSETLSDLLDTDGGFVNIPDAHNIRQLHVLGASLLVFAENGVWAIAGVDNVFRATEYAVTQVSDIGLVNEKSFVVAGGQPFWWSKVGIYGMTQDEVTGGPKPNNISLPTIQTFWDNINNEKKAQVFAEYDAISQRIYWFYPEDTEDVDYKYNNILILDIPLKAFYPWKIADEATSTDYVVGSSYFSGLGATSTEEPVVDNGEQVTDSTGEDIVATMYKDFIQEETQIKLLVRDGATGKLTVGEFAGDTFLDWGTGEYVSYAESAYDFMGDMISNKTAPYVSTYFRVTEDGYVANGSGGYDLKNPSSCKLSVSWNLNKQTSTPREVYRLKDVPVVDPDNLGVFPYPTDTVITRSKVRGKGKVMKLRFESTAGYDFHLIGYEVLGGKNTTY